MEQALLPLAEAFRRDVPGIERTYLLDGAPPADWLSPHSYEDLVAAAAPHRRDVMEVDENALAELFYTSGTSDAPRGVMLTHRNIYLHALLVIASGRTSRDVLANTSCDTVTLHTIPLFHANGWGSAHTVTLVGGTHVMVHQFVPADVLRLIDQEKVTNCSLVPTMATALVNCADREKYDLSSLRCVMIGGAASAPTLVRGSRRSSGARVFPDTASPKRPPVLTVSSIKKGVPCDDEARHLKRARAGYAIPGVEVRVVDGEGRDVPRDGETVGEVVARGDVIMDGYWKRPADSRARHAGWMVPYRRSGDGGQRSLRADCRPEEGHHRQRRREHLFARSREGAGRAPAVYEAVVIPVPDEKWGEVPRLSSYEYRVRT